jgi:hypothetical protein
MPKGRPFDSKPKKRGAFYILTAVQSLFGHLHSSDDISREIRQSVPVSRAGRRPPSVRQDELSSPGRKGVLVAHVGTVLSWA